MQDLLLLRRVCFRSCDQSHEELEPLEVARVLSEAAMFTQQGEGTIGVS